MKILLTASAAYLLLAAGAATAQDTNFGVRTAPGAAPLPAPTRPGSGAELKAPSSAEVRLFSARPNTSLGEAVAIASRLGRVTSTRRTVSRNRAVGGAPNSYHLRGRAVDVVPYSGVRHADIEAALRRAGFSLIESLNEGDHSHFAFGSGPIGIARRGAPSKDESKEVTQWRIVTAPRVASR